MASPSNDSTQLRITMAEELSSTHIQGLRHDEEVEEVKFRHYMYILEMIDMLRDIVEKQKEEIDSLKRE